MRPRTGTVLLALAALVAAEATMAAPPPRLPKPRPVVAPSEELSAWAGDAAVRFDDALSDAGPEVARLPRPRPVVPATLAPSEEETPSATPPTAPAPVPPPTESAADYAACLARLGTLGVAYSELPPLDPGGSCQVARPLKVTSLGSGVDIAPETILDCATTRALAEWVKEVVVPEAERKFGTAPTKVEQASAYVCRNRYGDPKAKLSEHAHANAIDIAAFSFAARSPIGIGRNARGSNEANFETAIRAGSCRYFTTVLGPGSNAAHATHFHLDLAERKGGYRICELEASPMIARAPEKTSRE